MTTAPLAAEMIIIKLKFCDSTDCSAIGVSVDNWLEVTQTPLTLLMMLRRILPTQA